LTEPLHSAIFEAGHKKELLASSAVLSTVMTTPGAALSSLHLYRRILTAAKDFPSVKKHSIIREIKAEFRRNRALADAEKIQHCRAVAERGLSDLEGYARAAKSDDPRLNLKGATQ
jgi:hypothetical protein